jgi:hypothetical protein
MPDKEMQMRKIVFLAMSCLTYAGVALAGAVVVHQDLSGVFLNPCNGELIAFSGDAVFVTHIMPRPDGSVRANIHANTQGVNGVGLTTGAQYQLIESVSLTKLMTPDNDTVHERVVLNVVGHGDAPNFFLHVVEIIHVDFATGDVDVKFQQDRTECR